MSIGGSPSTRARGGSGGRGKHRASALQIVCRKLCFWVRFNGPPRRGSCLTRYNIIFILRVKFYILWNSSIFGAFAFLSLLPWLISHFFIEIFIVLYYISFIIFSRLNITWYMGSTHHELSKMGSFSSFGLLLAELWPF